MAWIESHIELERHPKTLKLKSSLGCSLEHTLGVLHRLWYWTLAYAENGNLEKYGVDGVSEAIGIDAQMLIDSGWIDVSPCMRVHDWWDYIGRFLQSKYKNYPLKWKAVQRTYLGRTKAGSKPKLPNLTKPNHHLTITNQTKPTTKDTAALGAATPQAAFINSFRQTYEAMVHQPFKAGREHYVISSRLIKDHGLEAVILKARLLGALCANSSAWFTKSGWGDYRIETLSKHWNSILEETDSQEAKDRQFREDLKKKEAENERVNSLLDRG